MIKETKNKNEFIVEVDLLSPYLGDRKPQHKYIYGFTVYIYRRGISISFDYCHCYDRTSRFSPFKRTESWYSRRFCKSCYDQEGVLTMDKPKVPKAIKSDLFKQIKFSADYSFECV